MDILERAQRDARVKAFEERTGVRGNVNENIVALMSPQLAEAIEWVDLAMYEGQLLAVKTRNQMFIGRLKTVRARTRGNTTLALVNATRVQRNRRVVKQREVLLWTIFQDERDGYDSMCNIYRYVGHVPEASECSPYVSSNCPRTEGHAPLGYCVTCPETGE